MEVYKKEIDDVLEEFKTNLGGLSNKEVKNRILKYGKNLLPKAKRETIVHVFFRQFVNPIIFILIIAVVLSFMIGEIIDGFFILGIILFNAFLGTFQEWRAGKKALSLQNLLKVNVKVIRNGREAHIESENLVIGDIVLVEPGDKISADLRIIDCHNLSIDEAILTGESVASSKRADVISKKASLGDRKNMLFAGSTVVNGRGKAIVVAVSADTEIGKIAEKVLLSKETKSPLVIRMEKFTKQIAMITAIIAIIIAMLLYYRGEVPQEIFFMVVALSVSAIPEGLPVALTFALTIASSRMSKKNVLVKKLNSVESLGSCTVIASDKTGTLTLNEQTAKKIVFPDAQEFDITGVGYNGNGTVEKNDKISKLSLLGIINNEAFLEKTRGRWDHYGDSMDVAFLSLGVKAKVQFDKKDLLGLIPYESENKYSAAFYESENKKMCTIKGSIEKVLLHCNKMNLDGKVVSIDKKTLEKQNEELAKQGYRVIAIAEGIYKGNAKKHYDEEDIPDLTFVGMVGFIDPIREEAISAIDKCRDAGIKVVMITGDHPLTAYTISVQLGLASSMNEVTDGDEVETMLKKGNEEFDKFVSEKTVFTRVSPLQKLEIVNAYKRMGDFIAVTGDGVNDAPALKAANIGVAVGSGTDVAKETGNMIITDDNFLSIVDGIEEGRVAYSNVRKVILMLLSTGAAEVLLLMMAIIANLPLPLVAAQILWLNLVTNGIQDVALAFEKKEPGIMGEKPRSPQERIFNAKLLEQTALSAIVIAVIVFAFWKALLDSGIAPVVARGYILLLMVFMQNVHVFNCRSERTSLFKMKFSGNPFVFISIFVALALHFAVTQTSLSFILSVESLSMDYILYIFLLATPIVLIMELYKYMAPKRKAKKLAKNSQ